MKSILLISGTSIDLAQFSTCYAAFGNVDVQSQQRVVVEGEWGWFALNQDSTAEAEMDEAELDQVRRHFAMPYFFQLEYSSQLAVELAISNLKEKEPLLVDNDQGLICSMDEVRAKIAKGASWLTSDPDLQNSPPTVPK